MTHRTNATNTRLAALIIAIALPLAACTPAAPDTANPVSAPQARVVGAAENCIETRRIETTRVYDDYTIDFELAGGTVYRNTLPNRCASLGFNERFGYDLRGTTRLCSTDVIRVLEPDGQAGVSCGLGQFVPVELVED